MSDSHDPDPTASQPLGDVRAYTRRRRGPTPKVLVIAILGALAVTVGGAALMAMILAAISNALH